MAYFIKTTIASAITTLLFAVGGMLIGVIAYVLASGIGVLIFAGISSILVNYMLIFGGIAGAYALIACINLVIKELRQ